MTAENILSYDEATKTYKLGTRLITLGARASEFTESINIAKSFLEEMTKRSGIVSHLLQSISETRILSLAVVEPEHNRMQMRLKVGDWYLKTAVASGLCQLAYMDTEHLENTLDSIGRDPQSIFPQNIRSFDEFYKTLEEIRLNGYCLTQENYPPQPMVQTFSSPIFGYDMKPDMSISLVGIYASMDRESLGNNIMLIKEYSKKITLATGGRYPY